jgi:hypothetical protein
MFESTQSFSSSLSSSFKLLLYIHPAYKGIYTINHGC